jgi:hypothetical protein
MPIRKKNASMKSRLHRVLVSVALASALASSSWALEHTALKNIQSLSFGRFVADNGGSVTVSAKGNRSAGGNVVLMPSNQVTAALFMVSGDPDATYTVQLPSNDFVTLTGPGVDMVVGSFTSIPSGAGGQLGTVGSQTLSVGATLKVGRRQTPGGYSGSFSVMVDYN